MDVNLYYKEIISTIIPYLQLSGWLSLTIVLIITLINILINAFSGKGLKW